ncbi:MAG: glycogen phosphorylase, partial [Caldiserica bacterium]
MNRNCSENDLWKTYRKRLDVEGLGLSILNHIHYTRAKDDYSATDFDRYLALAYTIRDRIVERWSKTQQTYYNVDAKRVYYLSLEFLLGKLILNNIINLGILDEVKYVVKKLGFDFEKLIEQECDAGLGNGGLGRLAACFLDSMATLEIPGYGYGLRYEFGIFNQVIKDGWQVEEPEEWLKYTYPWEIERPEYLQEVSFYGRVVVEKDEFGKQRFKWIDTKKVLAVPHDIPIIGYKNNTVNTLRLWSAKSSNEFDLQIFNQGDYVRAVEDKNITENISRVLYPSDNVYEGKELRFKQEYFFVSATLKDIIRRYRKTYDHFDKFPEKVAIQLNDTHPALAIPELMRLLVDEYDLEWEKAWDITTKVFAFTNHTILPEALEKWPIELFNKILPRHIQIIYEINRRFLNYARTKFRGDEYKLKTLSLIDDLDKQVRMANLCIVGSHSVNGVSKLHTEIVKNKVFPYFYELYPEKFNNKTNGITPRRWLLLSNPELARLITERIGDEWVTNLDKIKEFEKFSEDEGTIMRFGEIRKENKLKLSKFIKEKCGITVNPDSVFDAHIKRIHEYKRQLLNAIHILLLYNKIKNDKNFEINPVTFIFGGKAAPGYFMAKLIIKFINTVADIVNNDKSVNDLIKVVFIPNYGVSVAEKIIPASDLNQQISTAGTEASGTGNMKFTLNGSLMVATIDGANIEIMERVGKENVYTFGLKPEDIENLIISGEYNPWDYYNKYPEIKEIVEMIKNRDLFRPIYESLMFGLEGNPPDKYFVFADLLDYDRVRIKAINDYKDKKIWFKKAIKCVSNTGYFSSDRAIKEYAEDIWKASPVNVEI